MGSGAWDGRGTGSRHTGSWDSSELVSQIDEPGADGPSSSGDDRLPRPRSNARLHETPLVKGRRDFVRTPHLRGHIGCCLVGEGWDGNHEARAARSLG